MTKVIKANGLLSLAIAFFFLCSMTFLAANYAFAVPNGDCEACGGPGSGGSGGRCYDVSYGADVCAVKCWNEYGSPWIGCRCMDSEMTCEP